MVRVASALMLVSAMLSACNPGASPSPSLMQSEAADNCLKDTVSTLVLPQHPGQPESATFNYRFEHLKSADASKPTIVFIPGGPGGTSIGDRPEAFPEDYSYVLTDPRGVGCNQGEGETFADDFFRTENLAADVLAVVKSLSLDNYIIYGVSYGSLLATVTASLGERQNVAKPKAIMLEGILGRAFETRDETYGTFASVWTDVKAALPKAAVAQLESKTLPFGHSSETWASAISNLMIYGSTPQGEYLPNKYLALLASPEPTAQQPLKELVAAFDARPTSPEERRLYRLIACHEIAAVADDANELLLTNGALVPKEGDICGSSGFNADKFAAEHWPITTPIYYFQGDRDPSTPVWQAEYHYKAQTQAPRTFALVKGGGHGAFEIGMADCAASVFAAIDTGGSLLTRALETCALPIEVKTAAAQTK